MQNEAAVGLYRPAEQRWPARQCRHACRRDGDRGAVEQRCQVEIGRPVDDQPQRPIAIVLGDIDQCFAEAWIVHGRHGDQKMVDQRMDVLHGRYFIAESRCGEPMAGACR